MLDDAVSEPVLAVVEESSTLVCVVDEDDKVEVGAGVVSDGSRSHPAVLQQQMRCTVAEDAKHCALRVRLLKLHDPVASTIVGVQVSVFAEDD